MTAHTPGPWTFNPDPEWPDEFNVRDSHGFLIVHVTSYKQSEADAHLIAAAPQLLEALLALLVPINQKDGTTGYAINYSAIPDARIAIATAGGQP